MLIPLEVKNGFPKGDIRMPRIRKFDFEFDNITQRRDK